MFLIALQDYLFSLNILNSQLQTLKAGTNLLSYSSKTKLFCFSFCKHATKGVFRTVLNILDAVFRSFSFHLSDVNYFCKMLHLRCLTGFWIQLCINIKGKCIIASNNFLRTRQENLKVIRDFLKKLLINLLISRRKKKFGPGN